MARQDNTTRITARNVLAALENHISAINKNFQHADGESREGATLDAAFIASRNADSIARAKEMYGLLGWFLTNVNQLNDTAPAPFDDAAVDAIDIDIRTFDDGNP